MKGKSLVYHCYHGLYQAIPTFGCNLEIHYVGMNGWVKIYKSNTDYSKDGTASYSTITKDSNTVLVGNYDTYNR